MPEDRYPDVVTAVRRPAGPAGRPTLLPVRAEYGARP
jgi:hypothetical protein